MNTYLIKKTDILKVLDTKTSIEAAENAFRIYGQDSFQMPSKSYINMEAYGGDYWSMLAYIPEIPIVGLKAGNVHPENYSRNMPTIMATIQLVDPVNGFLLAVMDGSLITHMRTGAAAAIASKYLANKNPQTMGFIGAGAQAMALLDALMQVYPEIQKVKIFDIKPEKSQLFKEYIQSQYKPEVEIMDRTAGAVTECQIVNTTTSARQPLFSAAAITPGTHINAMGADTEGKQEMAPYVLKNSILVVDDWRQASMIGECNVPYHMGELTRNDVDAVFSDVVTGKNEGRREESDITIFDSSGLALQDVVTAWGVYNLLVGNDDLRNGLTTLNFLD